MGDFNQAKYIQKYQKEKYDRCIFNVPKGQREIIEAHWKSRGYKSLNAYINDLIKKDMKNSNERSNQGGVFVIWNMQPTHNKKTILTIKSSDDQIRLTEGETVRQYKAMPGRSLRSRLRAWLAKPLDLEERIMIPYCHFNRIKYYFYHFSGMTKEDQRQARTDQNTIFVISTK